MVGIDFSVKEVAGVSRIQEMVALSIPFSRENSISETEKLVVRDRGVMIPVQSEVLSRYEDGSVRRLCAIFPVDVEANQSKRMVIESGGGEEVSEALKIRTTDETITIASDLTKFRISKQNGAVESVLFRGEEILKAPLGPCFSNLGLEMEDGEAVIEASGPYRARIVVKGLLKPVASFPYPVDGLGLLRGRIEITAYASSPRLDYTFRVLKWGFGSTQFGRMMRPEEPYSPGITVQIKDGGKSEVEVGEGGETGEKALIPASNLKGGYASVRRKDSYATLVFPEVSSWGKGAVKVDVEDGEVTYWAAYQPAFIELNEGREISLKASLHLHPLSLNPKLGAEMVTKPLKAFIDPKWYWENLLEGAPGECYARKDAEILKMARDMIVDKCFYNEGDLRGSLRNKPEKFGSVHGEVTLPREPVTEQDLNRLRRLLCEASGFYSRLEHAEYLLREFYRSGDDRLRDLVLSWAERTVEYAIYRGWDENLYGSKPHAGSELQAPGAFVPYMMRGTRALVMVYEETGNRYFLEAARDIVDCLIRNQSLVGTGHLGHVSGSRVPTDVTQSREGYACRELIFFGLYTGEQKYIDAARKLGEALIKCQNSDGSWCMPYDVNGKPLPHPAIGYEGHALMIPYVLKGLLPLSVQFSEWEALRNGVKKALDWLISVQREDGSYGGYTKPVFYWHDPQCAEVLLDAYDIFGDDRFLERAMKIKDMLGAIIQAYPESVMVPYAGEYTVLISWQVTNYPEIVYRCDM